MSLRTSGSFSRKLRTSVRAWEWAETRNATEFRFSRYDALQSPSATPGKQMYASVGPTQGIPSPERYL